MHTTISLNLLALVTICGALGCGATADKPSYADLVVVYNAELESLDRLEQKRAKLVADYEATLRPSSDEALQSLLGELGGAGSEKPKLDAADPNELLDQAIANAEHVEDKTAELLKAVSEQSAAETDNLEPLYSEEFKQKLAEMDEEIAAQKARVERARKARDAAESE